MDPLTGVLELARVSSALLAEIRAPAPWAIDIESRDAATLHAVLAGSCWLTAAGGPPVQLMPGDVVLLPTNVAHVLGSGPQLPTTSLHAVQQAMRDAAGGVVTLPGDGAVTHMLCATYDYDHEVTHPLMSLLPDIVHVAAGGPLDDGAISTTLQLLRFETRQRPQPGSQAAIGGVIDLVFIHMVRAWYRSLPDGATSWLRGLRDPVVARSLALIHRQPARPWTLASLARESHTSRATLARRFRAVVGETPLDYLTAWRIDVAARRLRETDDSIAKVAADVGYASDQSFSRAFSRVRGIPPGQYRSTTRRIALVDRAPASTDPGTITPAS